MPIGGREHRRVDCRCVRVCLECRSGESGHSAGRGVHFREGRVGEEDERKAGSGDLDLANVVLALDGLHGEVALQTAVGCKESTKVLAHGISEGVYSRSGNVPVPPMSYCISRPSMPHSSI